MILEAWYGPAERDGDSEGLDLNVTIPVQALVNKSQLYIPGRRTKVSRGPAICISLIFVCLPPLPTRELANVCNHVPGVCNG